MSDKGKRGNPVSDARAERAAAAAENAPTDPAPAPEAVPVDIVQALEAQLAASLQRETELLEQCETAGGVIAGLKAQLSFEREQHAELARSVENHRATIATLEQRLRTAGSVPDFPNLEKRLGWLEQECVKLRGEFDIAKAGAA